MADKKHWWQDTPLTISAVQCSMGDSDEYVLDEYVSKNSFNTEQLLHLVAKGHMGYYSEADHGEKLDAYLKKSRAHGIREIVYHNTHCINDDISREHPDWLQLEKDGSSMPAYSIYNLVCVNPNGAWHKNFLKELEDLCRHDVDGVFLDGPVMRDTGCYCETCRRDFEKLFGHSIYDASRIELQTLRVDNVTEHIKQAYETVKHINPEIALYLNNSALRADVTGNNTRKVSDYVDILGTEGGFHKALMGSAGLWQVSAHSKYLECISGDTLAGKKPMVCFFAGNRSGISYYMHTPAETELTYAQSYANGSNIWYGVHFSASEFKDTPAALTAKRMNQLVLDNRDIFAPSKVCARVALMWSQDTANNYSASVTDSDFVAGRTSGFAERGDHHAALMSVTDMLIRSHIQFDIIDEVSVLDGTVFNYDSVILPEVACMSEQVAAQLRSYVSRGGNLLGNFDVGMYDADGNALETSSLGEVFGLTGTPKLHAAAEIGTAYMFTQKDDPLLDALSFHRIPAPLLNAEWTVDQDAQVLMLATPIMPSRYSSLPALGCYPAIVKHPYGSGCAYYICGNYGETVAGAGSNITDYPALIKRWCSLTSRQTVVSDHPGLYEVVLRRQENRFLLHVINLTGAMSRPLEQIVPLHDVEFKLDLNGFGINKDTFALSTVRGASVSDVNLQNGTVSFKLDKLDTYEIVVIE